MSGKDGYYIAPYAKIGSTLLYSTINPSKSQDFFQMSLNKYVTQRGEGGLTKNMIKYDIVGRDNETESKIFNNCNFCQDFNILQTRN